MEIIHQTYHIKAPVAKVWQALVEPKIIEQWSGASARMDEEVGTKFELWGGDIYGINTLVIPQKKLGQDWYGGDWPKPSKVTFVLSEEDGATLLEIKHWDFPEKEKADFEDGWKRYYCGAIKDLLED